MNLNTKLFLGLMLLSLGALVALSVNHYAEKNDDQKLVNDFPKEQQPMIVAMREAERTGSMSDESWNKMIGWVKSEDADRAAFALSALMEERNTSRRAQIAPLATAIALTPPVTDGDGYLRCKAIITLKNIGDPDWKSYAKAILEQDKRALVQESIKPLL